MHRNTKKRWKVSRELHEGTQVENSWDLMTQFQISSLNSRNIFFWWGQYFPTHWVKREQYKTKAKGRKSSEVIGVSRGVNSATRTGAAACSEELSVNYTTGKKSRHWKLDPHFSCHTDWHLGTHVLFKNSLWRQNKANRNPWRDKSLVFLYIVINHYSGF